MRRPFPQRESRAMLDEGQPLRLVVAAAGEAIPGTGDAAGGAAAVNGSGLEAAPDARYLRADGDVTLLPLYLDPNTKLFLVALMWCRPWLIDPGRSTALPRTPEIARAALECTDAHHEIERFDTDPAFRDRLSARVGEHLKVLRRKIVERGLVRPGTRLSDEVAVGALITLGTMSLCGLALNPANVIALPIVVGVGVVNAVHVMHDYLLRRGKYCPPADAPRPGLILLDLNRYSEVRRNPRWFVTAPGHEHAALGASSVVQEYDNYLIIEKKGRAGEVAEALADAGSDSVVDHA